MTLAKLVEGLLPGVRVVPAPSVAPPSARGADGVERTAYPRNFRPNTPQRRAKRMLDEKRIRFFIASAGRRGSKTQFCAAAFADLVVRDLEAKTLGLGRWEGYPSEPWVRPEGKDPKPFLRYFVVSPVHALNDEAKIALRTYFGHVDDPTPGLIEHQAEKPSVWWLRGGVRIDFLSADRPFLSVSHGYNGGWMDEADRTKKQIWDNLRPALSDHQGWCLFSTTPHGGWVYRNVWAKANIEAAEQVAKVEGCAASDILDPEFGGLSWTTAENDALPHLAAEMEVARRQLPPAIFRREYLADWQSFEGQVFTLEARHLAKWAPGRRHLRGWAGMDLGAVGKTSHKTSFSVTVEDMDHVFREAWTESAVDVLPFGDDAWARRKQGDRSTWSNRLWHAMHTVFGDGWSRIPLFLPADASVEKRVLKGYGFNVKDAFQEHEAAVTWVQVGLHSGKVTVGSEVLWGCLAQLRYPDPGKASTKLWVNERDDEWDGWRYSLSELIRRGESPTKAPLSAMGWNRV